MAGLRGTGGAGFRDMDGKEEVRVRVEGMRVVDAGVSSALEVDVNLGG